MGHRYNLTPPIPGTFPLVGVPARMLIEGGQWNARSRKVHQKANGVPRMPQYDEPERHIADQCSTGTIVKHLVWGGGHTRADRERP